MTADPKASTEGANDEALDVDASQTGADRPLSPNSANPGKPIACVPYGQCRLQVRVIHCWTFEQPARSRGSLSPNEYRAACLLKLA
jgi:hypothetical protein